MLLHYFFFVNRSTTLAGGRRLRSVVPSNLIILDLVHAIRRGKKQSVLMWGELVVSGRDRKL